MHYDNEKKQKGRREHKTTLTGFEENNVFLPPCVLYPTVSWGCRLLRHFELCVCIWLIYNPTFVYEINS